MDEKKKPEASWEEREQLGPYRLEEQVQSEHSQDEIYLATHETSGATALVLKPASEEEGAQLKGWRVRLISSVVPGYIALEVEDSEWSKGPNKHSVDALMFLVERVRTGVRLMARAFLGPQEPRLRWRQGLALVGAAAVGALLFALVRLAPVFQSPSGPEPLASTPPTTMSDEVPTAAENPDPFGRGWLADTMDAGTLDAGVPVLAVPLPREPFKGQKRPPCKRPSEVELVGGCWAPHELKAPCPEDLYEYQGKCYIPAYSAKKPLPQSVEQ